MLQNSIEVRKKLGRTKWSRLRSISLCSLVSDKQTRALCGGLRYKQFVLRPGVRARFVSSYFLCLFFLSSTTPAYKLRSKTREHKSPWFGVDVRRYVCKYRTKKDPQTPCFQTAAALSDNALSPAGEAQE